MRASSDRGSSVPGRTRGLTLVAASTRRHRLGWWVNVSGPAAASYLGVLSSSDGEEPD